MNLVAVGGIRKNMEFWRTHKNLSVRWDVNSRARPPGAPNVGTTFQPAARPAVAPYPRR